MEVVSPRIIGTKDYSNRLLKNEWEVRSVPIDIAARLVRHFHYAKGSSNTATYLHGLFRKLEWWDENCMGIAWWIPPTKSAALATYPENWTGVLSLSRLVVAPDVPKNACSFLLGRSVRLIDRNVWPCLVTYADSWMGHTGTIYRSANWAACGMTKPESVFTRDGRLISRKAGPHTATHSEMIAKGCQLHGRHAKHKFVLMPAAQSTTPRNQPQ